MLAFLFFYSSILLFFYSSILLFFYSSILYHIEYSSNKPTFFQARS
ncbi:hypothetical protein [Vibrio gallaecicus]|nr:hypothetical protein [Vibrio gallaecicus]MDN3617648.1 hypothetical protein [Vibrio gallaecicus]